MAFDKYKNGAWMEPESSVKKYKDGAWTDCDSAKRYVNGAWSEVWANVKIMTEYKNSLNKGFLAISDHRKELTYMKIMDTDPQYGTISGNGGNIAFLIEGPFVDPLLTFRWSGGFIYRQSDGKFIRISAGRVYAAYIDFHGNIVWDATEESGTYAEVGSTGIGNTDHDEGWIYWQGEGTYKAIGIAIEPNCFDGKFSNASLTISISNVRLNNKYKIGFPESSEFDYQEWPS